MLALTPRCTMLRLLCKTFHHAVQLLALSVIYFMIHIYIQLPSNIFFRDQKVPNTPYHIKINGTHISMALSMPNTELYNDRMIDGINIQDGYWHHLVVTWEKTTGELTLFVDGEYNTQVSIGRGEELPLL